MKRRFVSGAVGWACSLLLFSGSGPTAAAQAQGGLAAPNPVLEAVTEDMGRLARRALADGWNPDLAQSFANNLEIAALSIDEDAFQETLRQAIAAAGGVDAFAVDVYASRDLEQELHALGYDGVQVPPRSVDDVRAGIAALQEDGYSSFLKDAATAMRDGSVTPENRRWACLPFLFSGSGAAAATQVQGDLTAQDAPDSVPEAVNLEVLEAVAEEMDRLAQRMMADGADGTDGADGWNPDLAQAIADNMEIFALSIDDGAWQQGLEQAIAAAGGVDAFAVDAYARHPQELEQQFQALGLQVPHLSLEDFRAAFAAIQENGLSSVYMDLATTMRDTATTTMRDAATTVRDDATTMPVGNESGAVTRPNDGSRCSILFHVLVAGGR